MGLFGFRSKKTSEGGPPNAEEAASVVPASVPAGTEASKQGWLARMRAKLNRGDSWLTYDLANLLPGGKIDENVLDELETRLIAADVGIETTEKILGSLRARVQRKELADLNALLAALRAAMLEILQPVAQPLLVDAANKPFVILVVGVNGSGKTTTIGKLAHRYVAEGRKVMLAAGDTFRAAAIEQLQVWGERNHVPVIAQGAGADPAAVTFDALQSAQARGIDVLIADTAGRLHTQSNLMEELKKVRRVLTRLDPTAPHEVLLVLDGSQGQNALTQAQQFNQAIGVTGLVMTKLDGTAKGGIVLAIADTLKLPIRFIGIGETAADFDVFDAGAFVDAVLSPARAESAAMIRFDHVSKRYPNGREAVSDLSLDIGRGEMVFLTGHSGAGKSTLLKLIALIERPSKGTLVVNGQNTAAVPRSKIPAFRRQIGVVFQDHKLLMDRPVYDNVGLPLVIAGVPEKEILKRVRAALDQVGLLGRERSRPIELSTGEQQRVGIARAIIGKPALLIADEPTGNLDPDLAIEVMNIFKRFNEVGVTVVIASHDIHLIERFGVRRVILAQGRTVDSWDAQPAPALPEIRAELP